MSTAPNVYFIDDSATMREVIKIAFRRESMNVIACGSADVALGQMNDVRPDIVITDVIMPEKDGYEVCQAIKLESRFGRVPVILMSGVVNRAVAEKAFAVKADELIRKPFQPQDLIARVRSLLQPKQPVVPAAATAAAVSASAALSSIFQTPAQGSPFTARPAAPAASTPAWNEKPFAPPRPATPVTVIPPAAPTLVPRPAAPAPAAPTPAPAAPAAAPAAPAATVSRANGNGHGGNGNSADVNKLKIEVLRLEGLVRKLQAELEAEREYARALEAHIKTLQEAD